MRTYQGTKVVKAEPMTRQAYNDYRGWELPSDEDGADEGFLVEYLDGGEANHPGHAGYISWSPATVFQNAYQDLGDLEGMADWQIRLVAEEAELAGRLGKLRAFLSSNTFLSLPRTSRQVIRGQAGAMRNYLTALRTRISSI